MLSAIPTRFSSNMEGYAKLGIDHVQVMPMGPDPVAAMSRSSASG